MQPRFHKISVHKQLFFLGKKHFKTKKVNIFWIFIKNKVVTLGTFLNFVYDSSYLGTKKVHGYLISFEPQMIRSSYKDHLSKVSRLFKSYMSLSFWRLLKVFGDKNLEISRQDLKTFYSYATSSSKIMSHSRQTLAVKLLVKIYMQYLLFRIIPLLAANLRYCFWLVKYTLDGISKIKIRVT